MVIKKAIENLINLRDEEFARYQVSIDPIEGKLSKELKDEIITKSLECGYEQADKLLRKQKAIAGQIDIYEIAKHLGIKIEKKESHNAMEYVFFGTFEEPGIITLYEDNIRKGEELVKLHEIHDLANVNLEQIILAHEVFHYIESQDKNLYVNTLRVKLWKLGPYTHTSSLVCAGEIAGMAFAKRMLNLSFNPNILDVLLLYPHNKELSSQLYKQIMDNIKKIHNHG